VLQDGNRIVKRSTARLARDTYGRTRQEKQGTEGSTVYVFDPIDHRSYALNPQRRTAVRIPRVPAPPLAPEPPPAPEVAAPPAPPAPPTPPAVQGGNAAPGRVIVRRGGDRSDRDVHVEVIRIGGDGGQMAPLAPMPALTMPLLPDGKGTSRSLGTREFDGVKADGTETTHTIAAGAIGNEKPIVITRERWFSPELQLVVYARTRDPRAGESSYRLTNLKRGEPPAELFRVPADYRLRGEARG
jgi:hypothetical protein